MTNKSDRFDQRVVIEMLSRRVDELKKIKTRLEGKSKFAPAEIREIDARVEAIHDWVLEHGDSAGPQASDTVDEVLELVAEIDELLDYQLPMSSGMAQAIIGVSRGPN